MSHLFDAELQRLKEQLLAMAGLVERAIDCAIDGLQNRDLSKTELVPALEDKIIFVFFE